MQTIEAVPVVRCFTRQLELDARFVLEPMLAELVKGIAEPAVREGPSAAAPSAEETRDR